MPVNDSALAQTASRDIGALRTGLSEFPKHVWQLAGERAPDADGE
ncbi:hypothetical protein ABT072_08200 [Streptomyces sp. NPDC002589]